MMASDLIDVNFGKFGWYFCDTTDRPFLRAVFFV